MIPEKAQERIKQLQLQVNIAQAEFYRYLEGIKDGMRLEGDWSLNTQTWEFEEAKEDE